MNICKIENLSNDEINQQKYFSELSSKLESSRSNTNECIQICRLLFIEASSNYDDNNANQWFDNIAGPLLNIVDLFSTSIKAFEDFLQHEDKYVELDDFNVCNEKEIKKKKSTSNNKENTIKCEEETSGKIKSESLIKLETDTNNDITDPLTINEITYADDFDDNFEESSLDFTVTDIKGNVEETFHNNDKNTTEKDKKINKKLFSCHECDKQYTTKTNLQKHMKYHTFEKSYKCEFCQEGFATKSKLVDHRTTHTGEVKCDICSRSFTDSFRIVWHKRKTHKIETPFSCDVCKLEFQTKRDFVTHRKSHTNETSYSCEICGKVFFTLKWLLAHRGRHKGGKDQYKCDVCEKSFTSSGYLTIHKRIHTGEKPYLCVECGKSFKSNTHLDQHKRLHSDEKPYACDYCEKTFRQINSLNVHRRVHTGERPYKCDLCAKTFIQINNLNKHKRTHTGERPYACDICEKRFNSSGTLKVHKRIHTGERPFPCNICNKSFYTKQELQTHSKSSVHLNIVNNGNGMNNADDLKFENAD